MERICGKAAAGRVGEAAGGQAAPHSRADKPGETTGERDRVPVWETNTSEPLALKFCGGCGSWEAPIFRGESSGGANGIVE